MNGRSERDRDGGNIISSGYHAVLLAPLSCCWTAVFLLFAFPPFLCQKTFLLLFFHFIILLLSPHPPKKEIYNSCPDLSPLFSSARFVLSALVFSVCVFSLSFPARRRSSDHPSLLLLLQISKLLLVFTLDQHTITKWKNIATPHVTHTPARFRCGC